MIRGIRALTILFILLMLPSLALAQNYKFSVDENISDVYVRKDGGIDLHYKLTFTCSPGAHAIDIVDVGLPNAVYDPGDFRAKINGAPVSDIRHSQYVKPGIEIHLGKGAIQPGQSGALEVTGIAGHMVYPDTEDPNYASVEFAPTFYGSDFTQGKTHLEIRMHFPKGVTTNETRWHQPKPTYTDGISQDHIFFTWVFENHRPSSTEKVGISLPRNYVDQVFTEPAPMPAGSSGSSNSEGCFVAFFFFLIFFTIIYKVIRFRWRLKKYLPPELSVAGVGIKRGLTAPEAALIREIPLDKVLSLILFGMIRKGAIVVEKAKPLKLRSKSVTPDQLRPYEKDFLMCIKGDGSFSEKKGQDLLTKFIKATNRRLKGFSRKETADYYKQIVAAAWAMVEKAKTPEEFGQVFDERADWLLMEKDLNDKFEKRMRSDRVTLPGWWIYTGSIHDAPSSTGSPTISITQFASSVTDSISGFASGLVDNVSGFTSSITQITNPPPKSSSGSCAGGGCACACACAGCACACAGGGR